MAILCSQVSDLQLPDNHDETSPFSDHRRAEHHIARSILATSYSSTEQKQGTVGRLLSDHFSIVDLVEVVQRLLSEENGCPWCEATSIPQILGWLRSEIQEVATELDVALHISNNMKKDNMKSKEDVVLLTEEITENLEKEIGDILFDSILLASLCEKQKLGNISLQSSSNAAINKICHRCPYIFNPNFKLKINTISEASLIWQKMKKEEKTKLRKPSNIVKEIKELKNICHIGDAIILFTKFPMIKKSKTRLISHLGENGAYEVALSMLKDTILNISSSSSKCLELQNVTKVIYFTPSNAKEKMIELIISLNLNPKDYYLIPMIEENTNTSPDIATNNQVHNTSTSTSITSLTSSDLGDKLIHGLTKVRELKPILSHKQYKDINDEDVDINTKYQSKTLNGSIAIIGMDCPELPGHVIAESLCASRRNASAKICPSNDGGYVLITLPPATSSKVFKNVKWSCAETCLSQINAIAQCGVPTLIGDSFDDMDEIEDLKGLQTRLHSSSSSSSSCEEESVSPTSSSSLRTPCPETRIVLDKLLPSTSSTSSSSSCSSSSLDSNRRSLHHEMKENPFYRNVSSFLRIGILATSSYIIFKNYHRFS